MRKFTAILLASALSVALLSACGSEEATTSAPPAVPSSEAMASSEAAPSEAPAASEEVMSEAAEEVELFSIDFELENLSGADLVDIRVSPSEEVEWGDNLLASDEVLPDGSSVPVSSEVMAVAGSTYDMKTVDSDGDEYEFYDIPLTEISIVTIHVEMAEDGTYSNYIEME